MKAALLISALMLGLVESGPLHFRSGHSARPASGQASDNSEDEFWVDKEIIVMVDSVGGWSKSKVIPGEYAKSFVSLSKEFFPYEPKFIKNPKKLLEEVVENNKVPGSATALILTLDDIENQVHISFIGDTYYLIFKPLDENPNEIEFVYKNDPMYHSFNFPFQVGTDSDNASISKLVSLDIDVGDLVIVTTNALLDNLELEEVIEIVKKTYRDKLSPQKIASTLVEKAFEVSRNPNKRTPFERLAQEKGENHKGGKKDDLSVVAAFVDE